MAIDARLPMLIRYLTRRLAIKTDPVVRAWLAELKAKDQS
jgi:hypothetical protein